MTFQICMNPCLSGSAAVWFQLFSCGISSPVFSPPFQTGGDWPFYLLDTSHLCKHILTRPTFRRFSDGSISTHKTWRCRTRPDPGKRKRTQRDCESVLQDSACSKLGPPLFLSTLLAGNRWQSRLERKNLCLQFAQKVIKQTFIWWVDHVNKEGQGRPVLSISRHASLGNW